MLHKMLNVMKSFLLFLPGVAQRKESYLGRILPALAELSHVQVGVK